jgi:hypothetical protein
LLCRQIINMTSNCVRQIVLSEHYTVIQGAENVRFCMTGEVSTDEIQAGRALCHAQIVRTMIQFMLFVGCKVPKWTQMRAARQFLSGPKVPNLIEVG